MRKDDPDLGSRTFDREEGLGELKSRGNIQLESTEMSISSKQRGEDHVPLSWNLLLSSLNSTKEDLEASKLFIPFQPC